MKKRIIAIALALMLLVAILPASALADADIYVSVGNQEFSRFEQTIRVGGGTATLSTSGEFPALFMTNVNLTQFMNLGADETGTKYYTGITYSGSKMLCIYCENCTITVPKHGDDAVYEGIYAEGAIAVMGNLIIRNADIGIEAASVESNGVNISISTTSGPALMADRISLAGSCYIESTALYAVVAGTIGNTGALTINHFPNCAKYGYGSVITVAADGAASLENSTVNMTADFSGYKGSETLMCSAVASDSVSVSRGNLVCNMNVKGNSNTIVNGVYAGHLFISGTCGLKCHLNLSGSHMGAVGIGCEYYNRYKDTFSKGYIESTITGGNADDIAFYVQNNNKVTASEIYASVDYPGAAAIAMNPGSENVYGPDWKTPLNMHTPKDGKFEWIPYSPSDILTVVNPDGSFANTVVLNNKAYAFRDIDSTNVEPYKNAILWAVEKGITNGFTPVEFRPTADCNRGQVVTFLWRANGSPEPTKTENPFVDVSSSSPYYKAILWAVEQGITNGFDATHFRPANPCTRAQVVTFLWRAEGKPEVTTDNNPFVDVSPDGNTKPYYEAILWAVENGITNGYGGIEFRPSVTCNRGQVVTFINRDMA